MPVKLITAPTFPLLEAQLLHDLREGVERDPLAPRWIVVPSATLANHLRVRLANAAAKTTFAGVRVVNLPRFTGQLCAALVGQNAPPWNPALDLTLFELVETLSANSPLANLKEISGGASLLRQAFTDLAEGAFGAEDISKVEELAEDPDLTSREQEVLRLFANWVRLLQKRGVAWSPLVLQRLPDKIEDASDEQLAATLCAEKGQRPQVFVYGFYDWIDVNLEWLAALSRRVPTTIYYPLQIEKGKTHPAFSFTESVLADVRGRFGLAEEQALETAPSKTANFFLATFPEGEIGDQPPFLTHQRAAGVRAEVISAAVRVRTWLDDTTEPLRPEEILVVAPRAEEYVEAVQDVFAAFEIPLRVTDVAAGPTPESEMLQVLARIWEEQAPAEWVMALLRACPDIPVANKIDVNRFEWKVRDLGVWGGAAWRAALERKKFNADDEDKGRREIQFDDAERKFMGEILAFVAEDDAMLSNRVSLKQALGVLCRMRDRWVTDPAILAPLIAAAEATAHYSPDLKVELRQWTRLLAEGGGVRTYRDPLCRAVLFAPLMRARGLTARAVVILGLAAGQLPFRVEDDPLLSESASAKLARVAEELGHRLPVKARVTEEMLLLFFLINTAAERVHWVVPESDAGGRAVTPTPWVQRYLQRWDVKEKEGKKSDPLTRRIARAPFEQAVYLAGLDVEHGSFLPPAMGLFIAPKLAAACDPSASQSFLLESVAKRGREAAWSGGIGARPKFARDVVGVTALENLAKCPFRFYAQSVAGWEPMETLSLSRDLDALTRGSLLHKLLEHAVRPHLKERTIGQIAVEKLAGDGAALWDLARRLPEIAPEAAFALAMLPPVFKEAALREVVEMAKRYFESVRDSNAAPQQVEEKFHRDFPGLSGLQVVGKIDRVDQGESGHKLIDYKSGKRPSDYRKLVKLGWQIQAALYPWLSGQAGAEFSYVFLKNEVNTGDATDAPSAETFLGNLAPIIEQGLFIPTSNQVMQDWGLKDVSPCRWCKFVSACRRFETGGAARHGALFQVSASERAKAILAAVPPRTTGAAPGNASAGAKPKRGKQTK